MADRPHDARPAGSCPELSGGTNWPFQVIGIAFALVGVVLIAYSDFRHRDVQAALARGEYASLSNRAAILFAGVGAKLGLTTIVRLVLRT